jgi:hypothetical protein
LFFEIEGVHMDRIHAAILDRFSAETGINDWRVKEALGIPLIECYATDVPMAKQKYEKATQSSEEQRAALKRWDNLALMRVAVACTAPNVVEACFNAPRPLITGADDYNHRALKYGIWKLLHMSASKSNLLAVYHLAPNEPLKKRLIRRMLEMPS